MTTVLFAALLLLTACADHEDGTIEGRPGGPYRLTLELDPARPAVGEETRLTFQLSYSATGKPVTDLQIAHERMIHNFITDLEFRTFSHIHHEDFAPIDDAARAAARFSFPFRFPHAGHYRIVSEFAHRDRNWVKQFDLTVGDPDKTPSAPAALSHTATAGGYTARLGISPTTPQAGFETELELTIERDGKPVDNLALHLGTELHAALWRDDGRNFGHLHSYTPRVAAIMDLAHDRGIAPAARGARIAEMMVQLMCLEAELVFEGPVIPMRYVFPQAGRYHLFLQVAPGGGPVVFPFVIDVATAHGAGS